MPYISANGWGRAPAVAVARMYISGEDVKHFFRNYSLVSMLSVVVAAIAIFVAFRSVMIYAITMIAESSSVSTARIALHPIRHDLTQYLEDASRRGTVEMPRKLKETVAELMRDSRVVRVKLYSDRGTVVFSTNPNQIGDQRNDNPGFVAAMQGKVAVKLIYRDNFNPFDRETEADNLVQAYLPVQGGAADAVTGVFETYTDVNTLVAQAERFEVIIALVTIAVMGLMYIAQLVFVFRSNRLIERQRRTIEEKSNLLEQLSNSSMARGESERKRWATDLHEGLAQTLGAVKMAIEGAKAQPRSASGNRLGSLIPVLQEAISQTRSLAMDLSPQGLDDLGLGAALRNLIRTFSSSHPAIQVELEMSSPESAIPAALKIVIYRTVEAVLKLLASTNQGFQVHIRLERQDKTIRMTFQDKDGVLVDALSKEKPDGDTAYAMVMERVLISGGELVVGSLGGTIANVQAEWRVRASDAAETSALVQ